MNNLPTIINDGIVLRPIDISDTDLIVKWRNNDRVKNNFIYRGKFDKETHEKWMRTKVKSGETVQYIIEYDEQPIGSIYFRDINKLYKSAEFGILIGEDSAAGKGIGFSATKLFVEFGFEYLKLHRISLRHLKKNNVAHRLYSEVGFVEEGVFRDMVYLDGAYQDVVFMAIVAPNH